MTTVIFSGHMVDAPTREVPRFPPDHVPRVRELIESAVAEIDDSNAVAISGAACGGDLLFCQAWLATGRSLEVFLPRELEAFLDESVRFAGSEWEAVFEVVASHPNTTMVAPSADMEHLANPHSANNVRIIERGSRGTLPLVGIFLWDGKGGDGPGGTRQMVSAVEDARGEVLVIEP